MEIPVEVPIMKQTEEYDLEQKRNALCRAEQDLASIISSAEDFFDSPSDKEALLQTIQNNPEEVQTSGRPFMKKIARAMIAVASLTKEVDEASVAVEDQHLTPAQVKVQITKALADVLADQRTFLETMMKDAIATERARYEKMLLEQKTLFEHKLAYMEGKYDSLKKKIKELEENIKIEDEDEEEDEEKRVNDLLKEREIIKLVEKIERDKRDAQSVTIQVPNRSASRPFQPVTIQLPDTCMYGDTIRLRTPEKGYNQDVYLRLSCGRIMKVRFPENSLPGGTFAIKLS
jgi:hypothetical protein